MAIRGRSYAIQESLNLQRWTATSFRVVTGGASGTLQNNYRATDVRLLRIEVPFKEGSSNRFFRAVIQ